MRISDWSSDVCSSDLPLGLTGRAPYIWGIADVAESGVAHADQNSPRVGNPRIAGHAGERLLQSPRLHSSLAAGGPWSCRPCRRSEERRGGKEGVSTFSSRWSPYHLKNKTSTKS